MQVLRGFAGATVNYGPVNYNTSKHKNAIIRQLLWVKMQLVGRSKTYVDQPPKTKIHIGKTYVQRERADN